MIQIIDTNGSKDIQKMVQLMIQMILMPQVEQCYLVLLGPSFCCKTFYKYNKIISFVQP